MNAKQAVLVIVLAALAVSIVACGTPQANKSCASGYQYYGRCLSANEARAANLAVQQPQTVAQQPQTVAQQPQTVAQQPQTVAQQWSCAGPAPVTISDAAKVLGLSPEDTVLTTVLYPRPGDSTPIGYVVGTSASESMGKRVSIPKLPACVTVDFDPGATKVSGTLAHSTVFHPKWQRVTLASSGQAEGLKVTIYWTPGVYPDGVYGMATESAAGTFTCPDIVDVKDVKHKTVPNGQGGCLMAETTSVTFIVPDWVKKVDYDAGGKAGEATTGTVTTYTATFWPK